MLTLEGQGVPETPLRNPPVKPERNVQYDLFASFFGDSAELSNTIELWDAIPKYAVSPRMQNALRKNGRLEPYEQTFVYATRVSGQRLEHVCRVAIQPVPVKVVVDKETRETAFLDFYPSKDEELIEEVIRKIFADQTFGIHDPSQTESWVRFSLQMVARELKARGKTRSLDEIKRSIEILSKAHVSLFLDETDDPAYSAPILADVTRVTRQKYVRDTSMTWVARLPALISKSVNELTYRQFNYGVLMSLSSQVARWLHKRLSHSYTNASLMDPYRVLLSSIQRDSGLLAYKRTNQNVQALETGLKELVTAGVLLTWEREERREGRKIVDICYLLQAHPDFIKDVKAANARLKDSHSRLTARAPVHKSLPGGR